MLALPALAITLVCTWGWMEYDEYRYDKAQTEQVQKSQQDTKQDKNI